MPITPKYTWSEDTRSITLQVFLPSCSLHNADIYVSDLVVKVNCTPYVLLLDLFASVDDSSLQVLKDQDEKQLRLTVQKTTGEQWNQLHYQGTKQVLRERREASMKRRMQKEEALALARKDKKYEEEKQTLRAQMAVDDIKRQMLEDLKADEKEREEAALFESFRSMQTQPTSKEAKEHQKQEQEWKAKTETPTQKKVTFASRVETHEFNVEDAPHEDAILELTSDGSFDIAKTVMKSADSKDKAKPAATKTVSRDCNVHGVRAVPTAAIRTSERKVPAPRASVQAEVKFTPRVFPTPTRESKAVDEENWLVKNRSHLKSHKGLARTDSFDISENDPIWLKAKADDFYRSKDYRSAASAYSETLTLIEDNASELALSCLSNRSASHLQLLQYSECISDCSTALAHLPDTRTSDDISPKLRRIKLRLYVRRGTAYCRTGKYAEAKADYGVALTMDNQNDKLEQDFVQLTALEKAHELKMMGDRLFRERKAEDAIEKYTHSLRLYPLSVSCLSNRAACYLFQNDSDKCIEDCTVALELLQRENTVESNTEIAFCESGPAAGSTQRRAWVVRTLVRRATAYGIQHLWSKAERDYVASIELDPTNKELETDLTRIRHHLKATTKVTEPQEDKSYAGKVV